MLPHNPKLASGAELDARVEELRAAGKAIVFTNGCFDILHPGHVDLLARARAQGGCLVLGLNADASIARIKGHLDGPPRPLNGMESRAFVLAGLASVDVVAPFEEDTPYNLIARVKPDVLVKGGDWAVENIVGRDVVEARGGRVLSLPLLEGYSTTGLIERICTAAATGATGRG